MLTVGAALSCGTDVKSVLRGHPSIAAYPSRLGHEFAGVVRAVGDGVASVAPGDRVFCGNSAPCGVSRPCTRGQREPVRGPALPARRLRGAGTRPARIVGATSTACPMGSTSARRARRAPRLRGPRARRRRPRPRRPRRGARRRLARADALRAARLRGRRADRARPPPRAARRRARVRRRRDRRATRGPRTSSGCASSPRAAAPTSWSRRRPPRGVGLAVAMAAPGGTVNLFGGCARDSTFTVPTARVHYDQVTLTGTYHHVPALPGPRAGDPRRGASGRGPSCRAGDRRSESCPTPSRAPARPPPANTRCCLR